MAKRKQLVSSDEAKPKVTQHRRPCSDCPWARSALPGWLGSLTAGEWLEVARSDEAVPCHAHAGPQCAGLAVYRRNTCKLPVGDALVLPADRQAVFATPAEFMAHHAG